MWRFRTIVTSSSSSWLSLKLDPNRFVADATGNFEVIVLARKLVGFGVVGLVHLWWASLYRLSLSAKSDAGGRYRSGVEFSADVMCVLQTDHILLLERRHQLVSSKLVVFEPEISIVCPWF